MASIGIKVPPALHRHIIGRNGAQVNKLKEENDVQISVPGEKMNSDEIRVEGRKDGVENVRKAILEIVERLVFVVVSKPSHFSQLSPFL